MQEYLTICYANTTDMFRRVSMKVWRKRRRKQGLSEDTINHTLDQWVKGKTSLCVPTEAVMKELESIGGPRHELSRKAW